MLRFFRARREVALARAEAAYWEGRAAGWAGQVLANRVAPLNREELKARAWIDLLEGDPEIEGLSEAERGAMLWVLERLLDPQTLAVEFPRCA